MFVRSALGLALAVVFPMQSAAQEAFVTQISAGSVTIGIDAPTPAVNTQAIIASLELHTPSVSSVDIDLSSYPIVGAPADTNIASVRSTGNNNSSLIFQNGLHAATVTQTGNYNSADILQTGAGNRASVYQMSSQNSALITQRGSNNTALIVQR